MKPATKILRLVAPDNGGPRKRSVLESLARGYGAGAELIDEMIAAGQLMKHGDRRGATWGLPRAPRAGTTAAAPRAHAARHLGRQAGFVLPAPLLYLLAAIALLGAVYGFYAAVDGRAYKRGAAEKQGEWEAANRAAQALQRAREQDVSDAIKEKEAQRTAAADRAEGFEIRWKEARREIRRNGNPLATCDAPPSAPPLAGAAPADVARSPADPAALRGRVRFTWDFVRLYDAAWTGPGGESVFGAAAGLAGAFAADPAAPAGPSAYGPDELLDVHGDNAARASACRRDFSALIEKIRAAEAAWGKRAPP
jgi:hypothetical protein